MAKAKIVTDISNKYFTNNKISIGTSVPTSGSYKAGDMILSNSANSSAFGWICTVTGTPGTWKVLQSAVDASAAWGNISGKPSTFTPTIGTTSTTAFRGDHGNVAYTHSQAAHAPSNAQRNADITKAEIESKLTGVIGTHGHHNILSCGNVTAVSGTTRPSDNGISMQQVYSNGYPTPYGNVMSLKGEGDGQLLVGWSGTDGAHAPVYVRSKRDNNAPWSEWAQIYTTANKPSPGDIGAFPTSGGTVTGHLTVNGHSTISTNNFKDSIILACPGRDRDVLIGHFGSGDGSYVELAISNADKNGWLWGNSLKVNALGELRVPAVITNHFNLNGHRFNAWDEKHVSIINAPGSEFTSLEIKDLLLGPHTGATKRFTMYHSAPSGPAYGDVWIQNN